MKNLLKFWIWSENFNKEYRIRAYIANGLIWSIIIIYGIIIPILLVW